MGRGRGDHDVTHGTLDRFESQSEMGNPTFSITVRGGVLDMHGCYEFREHGFGPDRKPIMDKPQDTRCESETPPPFANDMNNGGGGREGGRGKGWCNDDYIFGFLNPTEEG